MTETNTSTETKPVVEGGLYRHYKGKEYVCHTLAKMEADETDVVLYSAALDGDRWFDHDRYWVRPLSEWNEEIAGVDGKVKRFTLVEGPPKERPAVTRIVKGEEADRLLEILGIKKSDLEGKGEGDGNKEEEEHPLDKVLEDLIIANRERIKNRNAARQAKDQLLAWAVHELITGHRLSKDMQRKLSDLMTTAGIWGLWGLEK